MRKYLLFNAVSIACALAAFFFAKSAPWEQLAWITYIVAIVTTSFTLWVAHYLWSYHRAYVRNNREPATIDIGSEAAFPAGDLSNFTAYTFSFHNVMCASMEGLLQSLKFSSIEEQLYVCTLIGKEAKRKGRESQWKETQTLYWMGKAIDRHSEAYQQLIKDAFSALYTQNKDARIALLATGDAVLTHSIGNHDPRKTVLTEHEFCSTLTIIREHLKAA